MNAPSLNVDLWAKQGRMPERGEAAPGIGLIYQNSNNGIQSVTHGLRDEFIAAQEKEAVNNLVQVLPSRLRKKVFALRLRIEWMVKTYGVNHVGLQTMTIRENVTDRKEFERRFKSIATNAFPDIYREWLRVFERQERGCWHAHVVVVTKADIRTGTDVAGLNQLLKDKRDRKICKAIYYSGIKRLASENLRNIWKEFRRLCGIKEFKSRRQGKGARYYKFDACHLLPIISTAQALAVYVSKYISKGFEFRRPEDKGMRLVGSTRNVSRVCNERFSWSNGGGKLHRLKLGILARMLNINSFDEFAERFGTTWAYHLRPVIHGVLLPVYPSARLAIMDGIHTEEDFERGEVPPIIEPSPDELVRSHLRAYVEAKEILLRRSGRRLCDERFRMKRFETMPSLPASPPSRPAVKSWMDYTANEN